MKTEEELLKIIHDNEYFLPFESNAYIVSVNKKDDEIEMGLNVLMASPMVGENGEIRNPHARTSRYGLMFRLKLSDLFQLADVQQRVKDYEDDYKLVMEEKCGEDDRLHCTCVPSLRAAVKEARSEMFDLYHQACCVEQSYRVLPGLPDTDNLSKYDNQCMSTYEYAEEKLLEWGLLKPEQCLRRKLIKFELPFPLKRIPFDLLKDTEVKIPVDPAPVEPEGADEEKK